jgi:hypothetical protein
MEVDKMNKHDIDTLIFILHRDYEEYGYTEMLEKVISQLSMEIMKERVRRDNKFMKLLGER